MATPPVVSVVTPVFNCMPYLRDTLASVYHQSMDRDDVEMIAVDDGSTDGSLALLHEWAARWPQLRVVSQPPSGGPSAPRNVGIELARGEYLFFLDGDDCLGPRALERMVSVARKNESDIVLGKIVGVGRRVQTQIFQESADRAEMSEALFNSGTPTKLFRRSLILDHGLRFPEHIRIREDQHFVAACYLAAATVSVVADYDCYYAVRRKNGTNITTEQLPLATILSQVEDTVDIIRERASPEARPRMMLRYVRRDLLWPFGKRFIVTPPEEQADILCLAARYAADWVTDDVAALLSVPERLRVAAVQSGRLDYLLEVIEWDAKGAHARALSEGGRSFLVAPGFRRHGLDLPDDLFEVPTPPLVAHVDSTDWVEGRLVLSGHAFLEGFDSRDTAVRVVARHLRSDVTVEASVERTPSPHVNALNGYEVVDYSTAGFRAELDFGSALVSSPGLRGKWELRVIARHAEHEVDELLGGSRAKDLRPATVVVHVAPPREAKLSTQLRPGVLRVVVAGGPKPATGRPSPARVRRTPPPAPGLAARLRRRLRRALRPKPTRAGRP
jgi:glycosyltransferase involved in cell wall biosynthesis